MEQGRKLDESCNDGAIQDRNVPHLEEKQNCQCLEVMLGSKRKCSAGEVGQRGDGGT